MSLDKLLYFCLIVEQYKRDKQETMERFMTKDEIKKQLKDTLIVKVFSPKIGGQQVGLNIPEVSIECEQLGITVISKNERSQLKNRDRALKYIHFIINEEVT